MNRRRIEQLARLRRMLQTQEPVLVELAEWARPEPEPAPVPEPDPEPAPDAR